jgi:hypothetical protein
MVEEEPAKGKATDKWLFLTMANHWPPKDPPTQACRRDEKAPVAAGSRRTLALLAGSEAPDSRIFAEPRASLAALYIAVDVPFSNHSNINSLRFFYRLAIPDYRSIPV